MDSYIALVNGAGVVTGLLLRVPKFSKYLHGVTSLYPNRIDSIPYWFLPADKEGYVMTPASWEEMADPKDPYLKVIALAACLVIQHCILRQRFWLSVSTVSISGETLSRELTIK